MLKKNKKIFAIILCSTMLISSTTTVLARDNQEISTYGSSIPSSSDVYSNGIKHNVSGYSTSNKALYSNYCFKGVSDIRVVIQNDYKYSLDIKLYKKGSILDSRVETKTVIAGNKLYSTFTGLNKNDVYYLYFSTPCNFNGTVEGVE